ncbi:MAG: Fic family protein [Patescibacteria group bacterium]|nr:Fic family protein [Patescibacteria group bacterium]
MNNLAIVQHKNFILKNIKYKTDKKISRRILELQKKFQQNFNQDEQKKLAFSQKVDFVYNTTALEGNTYTYAETETLLSGVTIGGHTIKEENEILNQKKAWEFTLNNAFQKQKISITENLIKDIHWRVGKDTVVNPGRYRTGRVKIGGTNYAPPKTNQEIENLISVFLADFNNLKIDIYLKAIIIHFTIALIQPFFDGNKRTARLLMNFVLLQNNYPLFSIPVKIRQEYIEAMIYGYENLDINKLIKLLSGLMIKDLEEIV